MRSGLVRLRIARTRAMLGHALIASEDAKNFDEAKQVLKTAVNRDNDNPFAWLQLGMARKEVISVP